MTQLLIQPSGGTRAQVHYQDTIKNLVSIEACADVLPEPILHELTAIFPEGECAFWGLVPGSNDSNRTKWEKIQPGDVVVFTGKKRIFATGIVKSKFHNPALAMRLWGVDDNSATWEYMYTLGDISETDIPYSKFNELLGDNPNNNHMGFRIVDDLKASGFISFVGSFIPMAQPSVEEIVAAIQNLEFDDIQQIVDEWESLGREEFLRVHALSGAFKYLLAWGDGIYDAKAIAVQAIRIKHLELAHLRSNAFEGDARTIAGPLRTAGWEVLDKRELDKRENDDNHEQEIQDRVNLGPVEKTQLTKARIGQGKFKHNVRLRESKCRVTGISDPVHLRASHIKPWAKSNDFEKLDGNNGLMLAPHIDHLFDRGWISFSDGGDILYSKDCSLDVFRAFGLGLNINVGIFSPEQCNYLAYHRAHIFLNK
jgi:hypothetical protein